MRNVSSALPLKPEPVLADGEASAIRSVYQAIHDGGPTEDLIAIRYLEALERVADGRATKIILPTELSGIASSIAAVGELFNSNGVEAGEQGTVEPA